MRSSHTRSAALVVLVVAAACSSPEERFDRLSVCQETGTRLTESELERAAATIVVDHLMEERQAYQEAADADPSVSDERRYYKKYESTDDFLEQNPDCCNFGTWETVRESWADRPDLRDLARDTGEFTLSVSVAYRKMKGGRAPDRHVTVFLEPCGGEPQHFRFSFSNEDEIRIK